MPLKRIRELQQISEISEDSLAKIAGTTKATLKKWIAGKASPTNSQLRDLAIALNSTKVELLELDDEYHAVSRFKPTSIERGLFAWGHLGLRLPGESHSRWYPVSAAVAGYVSRVARLTDEGASWICVPTMSARLLYINTNECESITLLDEAADGVEGDWDHDLVQEELNSELAAAISEFLEDWVGDSSEQLQAYLEKTTKDSTKFDEIAQTHVHYINGIHRVVYPESKALHDNFNLIELEDADSFKFDLSNPSYGYDLYIPACKVCLIDAPLFLYEKSGDSEGLLDDDEAL